LETQSGKLKIGIHISQLFVAQR